MLNRQQILSGALKALSSGRPEIAELQLRELLASNARDVEACYQHARSLAALGLLEQAISEFQQLLLMKPRYQAAIIDLGIALASLGRYAEALAALEPARAVQPQPAELHFAFGLCFFGLGLLREAEAAFRAALGRNARIPAVHERLGATLLRLERCAEAVGCLQRSLELQPHSVTALGQLGDAQLRAGDVAAAVETYRGALALRPQDALLQAALGTALLVANDPAGAAIALERALRLDGMLADVTVNLGTAFRRLNRTEEAAAAYARALVIAPVHPQALMELGTLLAERGETEQALPLLHEAARHWPGDSESALRLGTSLETLGRLGEALELYERAAVTSGASAELHDAHGRLLHRLGRHQDALLCYARALKFEPHRRETQLNQGHALESLGQIPEAMRCFEQVRAAAPSDSAAVAGLASCAFRVCDWSLAEAMVGKLKETWDGIDALHPFLRFAVDVEPAALAASSRRTAQAVAARVSPKAIAPYSHERLRIAYLSPDFRSHPVAYAIAGVLEHHDRKRFETIGVALAATDGSDVAARVRASCGQFIDASTMGDGEVIRQLREREIDIAVDLAGFTAGARPEIFAARIAPLQVNYLGFAGSTGALYMDVMIADPRVVPRADEPFYVEKIARLPNCYLPFDRDRAIGHRISRAEAGLPESAFVFCAFTNGYKIARPMFEAWMRLLDAVPGSLLWLRAGPTVMQEQLIRAAVKRGVDAERLVFSPLVAHMDEHLARLQLADLYLDTAPYNAHTTAMEALWAGVPFISCPGRTFASSVGASVLTAAGLPELICGNLDAYVERAMGLARSPEALAQLRERVRQSRDTGALFDTGRYVQDLESLYSTLVQAA